MPRTPLQASTGQLAPEARLLSRRLSRAGLNVVASCFGQFVTLTASDDTGESWCVTRHDGNTTQAFRDLIVAVELDAHRVPAQTRTADHHAPAFAE